MILWMQFYCIVVHQHISANRVAIFRVVRTGMLIESKYEGWNFNSGNYFLCELSFFR